MWGFLKWVCFLLITEIAKATLDGDILLISHNHGVLLFNVGNKTNSTVLSADRPVVAFDIHRRWRQLFWATESTIYRTPLYDLGTTTPLAEVGLVGSLAVDWVHNHLYWSDLTGGGKVEVAHLDGRRRRVVHRLGGTTIGAMVLDPLLGKLFWLERDKGGNETRIVACDVDGSAKNTLYKSESIPIESPLAIDVTSNGLYYYNLTTNGSELWDTNYMIARGGSRLLDLPGHLPTALGLAKVGFYFSNKTGTHFVRWVKQKYTIVYGSRADHFVSLEPYIRLIESELNNSSQIRVVSEVAQPQWPNQCAIHQCKHECVVTSHRQYHHVQQEDEQNTSCVCRYGYVLMGDGRSCEEKGYLIYSSGTTFGRIMPQGEDNMLLYNDTSANIQTFDVDVTSEYVYWSDLFSQVIYRAPIEQLTRKEVVVAEVTAFGLAVDWLHGNVYWTDQSSVMVASAHGGEGPVVVVDGLASPSDMAVDPLDKYIFWVECSIPTIPLSIKRAMLDGSGVITLVDTDVSCGMSLTADHASRTLFFIDWAGAVSLCRYDGTGRTKLFSDVVRAVAIVNHQPLWTVIEYSPDTPEDQESFFRDQLQVLAHDLQPSMVKVAKSSHQPRGSNECAEVECSGVCLPNESGVPMCVCPGINKEITSCRAKTAATKGRSPNDYLAVVEITPVSVTLQCSGPLKKHNIMRPWVRVDEVDSLVPRKGVKKLSQYVHIDNQSLPFTVNELNPATTYVFTVQHGVTRGARTIQLHTPPPPLAVRRLPVVTVPGIAGVIPWESQGPHMDDTNPWEHIVSREYFLLLLSGTAYTQFDPPSLSQDVFDELRLRIKKSFLVLKSYTSEEQFDDDPEMDLAHLPWGEEFQVAMVQATSYRGSYNLDIVYSKKFALPDPYWRPFVENILEDQGAIDSIERQ